MYKDYGYQNNHATHAHQYIVEPLINWLDRGKNKYILDLGCGNGALVDFLIKNQFNAYGTDASLSGIDIATALHPGKFAVQDLSSDNLPAEFNKIKFDTIISTEVIEHLYDPKSFILFCKQILQKNKGGEIILSTPFHGYLKNLAIAIMGKWDSHANPLWEGGHIKLWSKTTLSQLLEEQGFTVTGFKGCGRIPYFWKSMLIKAKL